MSLKGRESEINFREDYTKEDWQGDYPIMDSFANLIPPEEIKNKEDMWIKVLNDKNLTQTEKEKRMLFVVIEYVNDEYLKTLPKGKLIKYILSIPSGKLNKMKNKIKQIIGQK